LLLNPILTLILDGNFSVNAKVGEILKLACFWSYHSKCNFRPNDYYYDGISGYSIERGCDHWVRFEKKVDNTTVSLKAEEISRTKVLNASQAIQGKAAGVQVVSSDLPGSTLSYY
jgi:hypothetical protein